MGHFWVIQIGPISLANHIIILVRKKMALDDDLDAPVPKPLKRNISPTT